MPKRRIVAFGGGGFTDLEHSAVDDYLLAETGAGRPRVCFLATATGDAPDYVVRFYDRLAARTVATHLSLFAAPLPDVRSRLLEQDLIYVGGGNTASMLAVWRRHGVDRVLAEAWSRGIVVAGVSAGGMCWFEGGLTDSIGPELGALTDALGFLRGSFCPHVDSEPTRLEVFRRLVADRTLPGCYALDDGVALSFVGTDLVDVVGERPGSVARRLELVGGEVVETLLDVSEIRPHP